MFLFTITVIIAKLLMQSLKPGSVDTFWPVSIGGWFAVIVSMFLIAEKFILAWRGGQKPVLEKIAFVAAEMKVEVQRLEADFKDQLKRHQEYESHERDGFHKTLTHEINGWADRVKNAESEAERANMANAAIAERMLKSELDRARIHEKLEELKKDSRRSRVAVRRAEARIIQAIKTNNLSP